MDDVDLEAIVPGLRDVRAREKLARAKAFAGVTWTVCGCECVQLTPRQRLELEMVGNAFLSDRLPMASDVFQVIWRLNPWFARAPRLFSRPWRARRKCLKAVGAMNLVDSARQLCAYFGEMLQDLPESAGAGTANGSVHWMAMETYFYNRHGLAPAVYYMDTPYLQLQQLYRAHRMALGEDPNFLNESDALLNKWMKDRATQAKAEHAG